MNRKIMMVVVVLLVSKECRERCAQVVRANTPCVPENAAALSKLSHFVDLALAEGRSQSAVRTLSTQQRSSVVKVVALLIRFSLSGAKKKQTASVAESVSLRVVSSSFLTGVVSVSGTNRNFSNG